jgi:hypothetical protein
VKTLARQSLDKIFLIDERNKPKATRDSSVLMDFDYDFAHHTKRVKMVKHLLVVNVSRESSDEDLLF